jgi:MFS family permease
VLKMLKGSVMNKRLWKLVPMFALWQIATYITTPFYGTYQLNEGDLGFSMTFVAVLSLVYAVARSVFSIPIGKFADKYSFVNSLTLSYGLMVIAYGANIFFGKPFYIIYGVLQAIAMAGINSGTVNLIYDFVPHEHRTGTLAIKNTLVGFIGFFSTIAVTPLFNKIQGDGNKFLFVEGVRAQQVLSFFALLLVIAVLIYLNTVVRAMRRQKLQIEKATIYGSDHIEIKEKAKNESHR